MVAASEGCLTPRAVTPLKSLLKKQSEEPSLDPPDHCNGGGTQQETKSEGYVEEEEEGRYSPKKAVTFSEIDQVCLPIQTYKLDQAFWTSLIDHKTQTNFLVVGGSIHLRAEIAFRPEFLAWNSGLFPRPKFLA